MNSANLYAQNFGNLQIAGASVLILLAIAISRFFKLNLGKDLFVAALRTTAQLIAIGYILRWLLHADSLWTNALTLLVMTLVAAQAIHSRLKEKTWKIYFASFAALLVSVWPLGLISIQIFFGGEAFQQSLFFIPFMGVLMGNALASISLSFVGLERARRENLQEVETFRALGATPFESAHRIYTETLRAALTPIINGMTIVGLVSLPGVMAGQLIGGVDPLIAARFQILVMFLIAFTALTGSLLAVFLNHFYFMPEWLHARRPKFKIDVQNSARTLLRGPSGVGKSRLLKSLVGLDSLSIKEKITLGENLKFNESPDGEILYIAQKAFFVPGTVAENLRWPYQFKAYKNKSFNSDFIQQQLAKLNLGSDILEKNAMTLSGGESQIIHLLRSLQFAPEILFLDEITASLDPQRARLMERFLKDWGAENETRHLIFISHNTDQEKDFATRVLLLQEGQLLLQ